PTLPLAGPKVGLGQYCVTWRVDRIRKIRRIKSKMRGVPRALMTAFGSCLQLGHAAAKIEVCFCPTGA
ncbi:MAG: hypothetical protein WA784_11005, partial [Albidovulum sp.]